MNETRKSAFEEVAKLLSDYAGRGFQIEPETALDDERLGLDSMDRIEVILMLEEHFHISIDDQEADDISTVADIVRIVEARRHNG